jgi:hypothetical protein
LDLPFIPEDGRNTLLRNLSKPRWNFMTPHTIRYYSSKVHTTMVGNVGERKEMMIKDNGMKENIAGRRNSFTLVV